jgi:hypothetical protein
VRGELSFGHASRHDVLAAFIKGERPHAGRNLLQQPRDHDRRKQCPRDPARGLPDRPGFPPTDPLYPTDPIFPDDPTFFIGEFLIPNDPVKPLAEALQTITGPEGSGFTDDLLL